MKGGGSGFWLNDFGWGFVEVSSILSDVMEVLSVYIVYPINPPHLSAILDIFQ
jgi:hypothetical protein